MTYEDAIAAMFERNVAETLPHLREPVVTRPAAARRIVGLLAETIAGYASGCATRELAHRVHAWFGAELARAVNFAPRPPRRERRPITSDDLDVEFAPRRLVDELAERLRVRLALAGGQIGASITAVVAQLPTERERTVAAMFGELARTTVFDDRLGRELAIGWRCACAAIEQTPMPDVECPPRARDLWQIWSELVGNARPSETRQPDSNGYITLVR